MRSVLFGLVGITLGAVSVNAVNSTTNDLDALNYALTLEHLEAAFYTQFQSTFAATDFANAGFPASTYTYLETIMSHEVAHVNALTSAIQMLGGVAVPQCTYNFSAVTNVSTYLAYARVLENTGVSAYDGAINTITNPTLQEVAATIATVEARHASYLNELNGVVPFPNVTDIPYAPSVVASAVTPFIVSCGGPALVLPVERNTTSGYKSANSTADIATLQYALTLEHLEAYFYTTYSNITDAAYVAAGYPSGISAYIALIEYHEQQHVSLLSSVISSLGGTPVPACSYKFNVTGPSTFLAIAAALENTGVSAYDGAVNTITNPDLQQAAATIATVEGRHAAFLNGLNGVSPFPNITDPTYTPTQVLGIAGMFISSCPYNLTAAVAAISVPS